MRYLIAIMIVLIFAFVPSAYAESPLSSPPGMNKDAAMHNSEGVAALNKGKMAEAESHFREALKLDPKSPETHFNLGLTLHGEGKHAEAKDEFDVAKKLAPNDKRITESKLLAHHLEK